MVQFTLHTDQEEQVLDISERVNAQLKKLQAEKGVCILTVAHTTCALTTADLDPGTDKDFLDAIRKMFPKGNYRHPHNPDHVGDHIMSSIVGPSVTLPVADGELVLGTWQRVVLVELNGPRERRINLQFVSNQ